MDHANIPQYHWHCCFLINRLSTPDLTMDHADNLVFLLSQAR
jgi:hypothetical protein